MSYDLDSLVSDGVVRVAASRFPVVLTVDSMGISPVRFTMARTPGIDDENQPGAWVAIAWKSNVMGGTPEIALAHPVERVIRFDTNAMHLILVGGSNALITPSSGCGCGSQLKSYRGWPNARLSSVPAPKPTNSLNTR